jgi:hypothetical protein
MIGMAAVGKIQARNIHARFQQSLQNPRMVRCRTNSANDFGMSKTHCDNQNQEGEIPRCACLRQAGSE